MSTEKSIEVLKKRLATNENLFDGLAELCSVVEDLILKIRELDKRLKNLEQQKR